MSRPTNATTFCVMLTCLANGVMRLKVFFTVNEQEVASYRRLKAFYTTQTNKCLTLFLVFLNTIIYMVATGTLDARFYVLEKILIL